MKAALPAGRWPLWLALLAASAGLALFGDKTPAGAARPPVAAAPSGAQPPAPRPAPVSRGVQPVEPIQRLLARADLAVSALPPRTDLFATPPWRERPPPVPPVPPQAAPPAPPPAVPPPPYRVIGKKWEAPAWEVFLGRDELSFVARVGDTLEAAWRVERIEPPTLTLRHLPSGRTQTLEIGDAP